MKSSDPKPVFPELERLLIDTARAEASKAEAARRRSRRRRSFAFGGAIGATAIALLIVLSSGGGGSAVRPEVADAADLVRLGEETPQIQLLKDWQIVNTEASPEGGVIQFEFDGPAGHPGGISWSRKAEVQWHPASLTERGEQLESEGFTFAGTKPLVLSRPYALSIGEYEQARNETDAQIYVSHEDGQPAFDAVGLWEENGWTLEFRADVTDFDTLERMMERLEILNDEEWLVALQPGGGQWLSKTGNGTIEKVEKIKVGESPDGEPIYSERSFFGGFEPGEQLSDKLDDSFPTIYREGDVTRTVISQPPPAVADR